MTLLWWFEFLGLRLCQQLLKVLVPEGVVLGANAEPKPSSFRSSNSSEFFTVSKNDSAILLSVSASTSSPSSSEPSPIPSPFYSPLSSPCAPATTSRRTPPSFLVVESQFAVYETNWPRLPTVKDTKGSTDFCDSSVSAFHTNPEPSGRYSVPSSSKAISEYTPPDSN